MPQVERYTLQIADGTYIDDRNFNNHIIKTVTSKTNTIMGRVPGWGKSYTWRVTCTGHLLPVVKSAMCHFSTISSAAVDTGNYRLRILKQAARYSHAFVFCDKSRTLYDIKGNAVWYLPVLPGEVGEQSDIRDLKVSGFGTITFANNNSAYEVDYNGNLLWETPVPQQLNNGRPAEYHHELTRLSTGNYMVLSNEYVPWKWNITPGGDSLWQLLPAVTVQNKPIGLPGPASPVMCFGTVMEFDAAGKVVWSWKSSEYFRQISPVRPGNLHKYLATHENSFFFDEQKQVLWVSFKNLSQVMKVQYPAGNVTAVYGNMTDSIMPQNALFCHQHAVKTSKQGYLYLFNNNICHAAASPSAVMLAEPSDNHSEMKKIWEYAYPYKGDYTERRKKAGSAGGNVIELAGGELFVSMCEPYGNVVIVNQQKQLLWDAVLEKKNADEKKWEVESSYRFSIIPTEGNLEHLVFGRKIVDN